MATGGNRTKGLTLTAVATAVLALVLAATAAGGPADDALPDLVSDAPTGAVLQTYAGPDGTSRLLVRFSGFVHNAGLGPAELRGTGNDGGAMSSVTQRLYTEDRTSSRDVATGASMRFETADGHNHFHLRAATEYALWNQARSTVVAPSMKVGFCMLDSELVSGSAPRGYPPAPNCAQNNPAATTVVMGVSPGWRDVYGPNLPFQWVDVSDVSPGTYWLAARSDPTDVVVESDETNNGWGFAASPSVVPGWVARAGAVTVPVAAPKTVPLSATSFGAPGPVQFEIVRAPQLGTLDRAVGVPFGQASVVYTPRPGATGVDSFRILARDAQSAFPRNPVQATVALTLSGNAPAVAISGAPASLLTSTGAQLTAVVTGDPPGVTWSVGGVPGGSAATGTITPTGLYTAPAAVPPAGRVTVRAASANAAAEVSIAIQAPPPVTAPSPAPPAPPPAAPPQPPQATVPAAPLAPVPVSSVVVPVPQGVQATPRNPLTRLALSARGRLVLVGLRTARAGTVEVTVLRGGIRLGGCVVRTPAGRSLTCSVRLRQGIALRGLGVRVGLHANGKLVALRTARVARLTAGRRSGIPR